LSYKKENGAAIVNFFLDEDCYLVAPEEIIEGIGLFLQSVWHSGHNYEGMLNIGIGIAEGKAKTIWGVN
jgi:hypothetical protein